MKQVRQYAHIQARGFLQISKITVILFQKKKEITCSDCSRLHEDMACFSCAEDDSAIFNGQLCRGFIDKRKEELNRILMFWKVQGFYDRKEINELIDEFEQFYDSF